MTAISWVRTPITATVASLVVRRRMEFRSVRRQGQIPRAHFVDAAGFSSLVVASLERVLATGGWCEGASACPFECLLLG